MTNLSSSFANDEALVSSLIMLSLQLSQSKQQQFLGSNEPWKFDDSRVDSRIHLGAMRA
jgi:hypothetical protein